MFTATPTLTAPSAPTLPQTAAAVAFERGPYGEIMPPMLVAGRNGTQALDDYVTRAAEHGIEVKRRTRGESFTNSMEMAMIYVHLRRICEVLGGQAKTPDEHALYTAVVTQRQPMSLRLPALPDLMYDTFAPVVQRTGEAEWRVGVVGEGRIVNLPIADAAQAMRRAQDTYRAWANEEAEAFEAQAVALLQSRQPLLWDDYWVGQLEIAELWQRGDGFGLRMHGRHDYLQLFTPTGARILHTARERAVRLCDALAARAEVPTPSVTPAELIQWLHGQGAPPAPANVAWSKNNTVLAQFQHSGQIYAVMERNNALMLYRVRGGNYEARIALTALDAQLRRWLDDAPGREALLMWAFWKHTRATKTVRRS